ncbi:MAG: hypothetical protein WAV28_05200 [Sedimentisphaerales bacterium]
MKETYIITPAEKPRAVESNFVLVRLAKNAKALPNPVDRPANSVNPNAIKKFFNSIVFSLNVQINRRAIMGYDC